MSAGFALQQSRHPSSRGPLRSCQQVLFQIDPKFPVSEEDPTNARREVFNYGTALRFRHEKGSQLPLSLRLMRGLHAILMEGVRGSDQNPGYFRTLQNRVGSPTRYVPPPANRMNECLDFFEKYIHAESDFDPLVNAFLVHYQFEAIHPFRDGNGRVGRLLLAIMIEEYCGLSDQWLHMSPYFEANKDEYINLLLRVSIHGDWESWIEFCLRGVVRQATDTEARCQRLLDLEQQYKERLKTVGGSYRLNAIVDTLFESPAQTIPGIMRQFGVTYRTARLDVERLENANIMKQIDTEIYNKRPKVFFAPEILIITYED